MTPAQSTTNDLQAFRRDAKHDKAKNAPPKGHNDFVNGYMRSHEIATYVGGASDKDPYYL
jgi:hypothetical protein